MALANKTYAVEWLAKTADVQVRVNTLDPGASTPWHYHGVVTDDVFCLEREVVVYLRDPDEQATLKPGERVTIAPRRVHRVANPGPEARRYLLVQATGAYDFNIVPDSPPLPNAD